MEELELLDLFELPLLLLLCELEELPLLLLWEEEPELLELLDTSDAQAPEVEIPEEMQNTDETAEAANEEKR